MLRWLGRDGNVTGSAAMVHNKWNPLACNIKPDDVENKKGQTKLLPLRYILQIVEEKIRDRVRQLHRLTHPNQTDEDEMEALDQCIIVFEDLANNDLLERETTQWMNFKISFQGFDESSLSVHDALTQMFDQIQLLSGNTEGTYWIGEHIGTMKNATVFMREKHCVMQYQHVLGF